MVPVADDELLPVWGRLTQPPPTTVDYFLWKTQVLLHLHRHPVEQQVQDLTWQFEGQRAWDRLERSGDALPPGLLLRGQRSPSLERAGLNVVDSGSAQVLHRHFHYLGSPRPEGLHLGLTDTEKAGRPLLLALLTFSPFDLVHLVDHLPTSIRPEEVLVLSRQIAFPWSPRNTPTFSLARARRWLAGHTPAPRLLVTYLDPNVGFTGGIYQADNWTLLGRERKKRYLFLDGDYVTDREAIHLYGTADFEALTVGLGPRLERSSQPLQPLAVWARGLDRRCIAALSGWQPREIEPARRLVGE